MALASNFLLSNVVREQCLAKLKDLPLFVSPEMKSKIYAAVLLPLFEQNGEVHLLYTLRSSNLKSHSGQVSFPGGKMENNESVIHAALRETEEEIGIPMEAVEVWTAFSSIQGRNKDMIITPVVGVIKDLDITRLRPNIHEVQEIFSVPMSALCNPENHAHLMFNDVLLPVYLYEKYKIWGITGLITHLFLQCFIPSELYIVDFTRKKFSLDELMSSKL